VCRADFVLDLDLRAVASVFDSVAGFWDIGQVLEENFY
jgi:hypothetical protein